MNDRRGGMADAALDPGPPWVEILKGVPIYGVDDASEKGIQVGKYQEEARKILESVGR